MTETEGYTPCKWCAALVPDMRQHDHEYFHSQIDELAEKAWELRH